MADAPPPSEGDAHGDTIPDHRPPKSTTSPAATTHSPADPEAPEADLQIHHSNIPFCAASREIEATEAMDATSTPACNAAPTTTTTERHQANSDAATRPQAPTTPASLLPDLARALQEQDATQEASTVVGLEVAEEIPGSNINQKNGSEVTSPQQPVPSHCNGAMEQEKMPAIQSDKAIQTNPCATSIQNQDARVKERRNYTRAEKGKGIDDSTSARPDNGVIRQDSNIRPESMAARTASKEKGRSIDSTVPQGHSVPERQPPPAMAKDNGNTGKRQNLLQGECSTAAQRQTTKPSNAELWRSQQRQQKPNPAPRSANVSTNTWSDGQIDEQGFQKEWFDPMTEEQLTNQLLADDRFKDQRIRAMLESAKGWISVQSPGPVDVSTTQETPHITITIPQVGAHESELASHVHPVFPADEGQCSLESDTLNELDSLEHDFESIAPVPSVEMNPVELTALGEHPTPTQNLPRPFNKNTMEALQVLVEEGNKSMSRRKSKVMPSPVIESEPTA
nr:unnamed protein product [Digitaria exilis]